MESKPVALHVCHSVLSRQEYRVPWVCCGGRWWREGVRGEGVERGGGLGVKGWVRGEEVEGGAGEGRTLGTARVVEMGTMESMTQKCNYN